MHSCSFIADIHVRATKKSDWAPKFNKLSINEFEYNNQAKRTKKKKENWDKRKRKLDFGFIQYCFSHFQIPSHFWVVSILVRILVGGHKLHMASVVSWNGFNMWTTFFVSQYILWKKNTARTYCIQQKYSFLKSRFGLKMHTSSFQSGHAPSVETPGSLALSHPCSKWLSSLNRV